MVRILAVLGAAAAGAAAMYIFDPHEGRRRRALMKDKAVGLSNDVKDAVSKKSSDLRNRAQGLLSEAKSKVSDTSNISEANPFDSGEKVF